MHDAMCHCIVVADTYDLYTDPSIYVECKIYDCDRIVQHATSNWLLIRNCLLFERMRNYESTNFGIKQKLIVNLQSCVLGVKRC